MQLVRFVHNPEDRMTALLESFDLIRAEALARQVMAAAPGEWRYSGDGALAFVDGVLVLFDGSPVSGAGLKELANKRGNYNSGYAKRMRAAHNRWHVLHEKGYMKDGRLMWKRSNPSEYWKKNIQKAIKAHQDRNDRVLGDMYSSPDDRDLTGLDLSGADLSGAKLTYANLTGANLTGANLRNANLTSANLHRANLFDADLIGAKLPSANLTYANLTDAYLLSANLTDANLTGADLRGTYLSGAILTGARMPDGSIHK
jgi:Pentapeptide repeats (8 copies)